MRNQVTIHSTGSGKDTVIVDSNGNKIDNTVAATIELAVGEQNEVTLELVGTAIQVTGNVRGCTFDCPLCDYSEPHTCGNESRSLQPPERAVPVLSAGAPILFEVDGVFTQFTVVKIYKRGGVHKGISGTFQDTDSYENERKYSDPPAQSL